MFGWVLNTLRNANKIPEIVRKIFRLMMKGNERLNVNTECHYSIQYAGSKITRYQNTRIIKLVKKYAQIKLNKRHVHMWRFKYQMYVIYIYIFYINKIYIHIHIYTYT